MLTLLESVVLGIVQGTTEWLPVSSSGHLVLMQKLLNLEVPVAFDVFLHLATLLVIFIYFWYDIAKIINAVLKWQTKTAEFKTAIYITIATIATALIIFSFKNLFEKAFSSLLAVTIFFFMTGLLLLFSEKNQKQNKINSKKAAFIGLIQGLAFLPGISRSGSTISIALLFGIKREDAFKFSFLIAIPAILGASILKIPELIINEIPLTSLATGFIAAFFFGLLSLSMLKKIIAKRKLHYFAYYCFIIAALTLIIHLSSIEK